MKIAVTYENGMIWQHFGKTEQFKIYNIVGKSIASSVIVPTNGVGHGALVGFLKAYDVDVLICGGIGGGAQLALTSEGIKFYGGATGNTDEAVTKLLAGTLEYDPNVQCGCHGHGDGHNCR